MTVLPPFTQKKQRTKDKTATYPHVQIKNPGPEKKRKSSKTRKRGPELNGGAGATHLCMRDKKTGGARGEGRAAGTSAIRGGWRAQKPGAGRLEGKTGAALAWGALAWVTVAGSGME